MHIDELIAQKYIRSEYGYTPIDPGRQEYRKCGIRENKLIMQIEEVLYTIKAECSVLSDYAAKEHTYIYYTVYKTIRDHGWILIPYKDTKYMYELHKPNKHYNRKIDTTDTLLYIVSMHERVSIDVFAHTQYKSIVLAITDRDAFLLVESKAYETADELLAQYTPSKR